MIVFIHVTTFSVAVQNAKYRTINTSSKAFTERILPCPAARRLLDIAGFKAAKVATATSTTAAGTAGTDNSTAAASATVNAEETADGAAGAGTGAGVGAGGAGAQSLTLVHSNAALLTLVTQVQ